MPSLGIVLSHAPLGADPADLPAAHVVNDRRTRLGIGASIWQAPSRPEESSWLDACLATDPDTLPSALRHNLPDWLSEALTPVLGNELMHLVAALEQTAYLDLRVAQHRAKRKRGHGTFERLWDHQQ